MKSFIKFLFFAVLVIALILIVMLNVMGRPGEAQKSGLEQSVTTLTGWYARLGALKDFALAPSILLQTENTTLAPRIGVPDNELVTIGATDIRIPWSAYLARSGSFEKLKFENVGIPKRYGHADIFIEMADYKAGEGYVVDANVGGIAASLTVPVKEGKKNFSMDWSQPVRANFAEGSVTADVSLRLASKDASLFILSNITGSHAALPLADFGKDAACVLWLKTWAEDKPDFVITPTKAAMGNIWPWHTDIESQDRGDVMKAQEEIADLKTLNLPAECLPQ